MSLSRRRLIRSALVASLAATTYAPMVLGKTKSHAKRARAASARSATTATDSFVPYPQRDDVRVFMDDLAGRSELPREWIESVLAEGRYQPTVERLMQPPIPYGQRNWSEYRSRYVEETRIRAGVAFYLTHRATLLRAEERYGVPAEIAVAIIGVETVYGRVTGNYRTLDALTTLSFDYLRRAPFFRGELEQFLLFAREQGIDPLSVRGSFAGAIGIPQFMPTSIRKWAVDFDDDGRIDLVRSAVDSIGSVANFLRDHGWTRELPILLEPMLGAAADTSIEAIAETAPPGLQADTAWSALAARGLSVNAALEPDTPVMLLDLPLVKPDGSTQRLWRVGTRNFAAILGYNRSYFYAASVVELGAAIRARVA